MISRKVKTKSVLYFFEVEKMNKEREKKSVVGNWGTSTRQVDPLSVVHVLEGAFTWS